MMKYEIHPGRDQVGWNLYQVGDGGFDLVAWFPDKADAEFALQAFSNRG